MEGKTSEDKETRLDVGHVIIMVILQLTVIQWGATRVVGLDTKPKNVLVKEVNQEGFLHTLQEEELVNLRRRQIQKILKIKRQEPTIKYILKDGEKKLIKEVMEVSPAQSGAGHATDLETLQHIVKIWDVMIAMALGTKLKIVGIPWED